MQRKGNEFSEWFNGTFLCSRQASSPLLVSDNKMMKGKFIRIEFVCQMLLENPKKNVPELRKMVAMRFFISMRCALDYINYAKIVLEEWNAFQTS
jgi:hypothetical protein